MTQELVEEGKEHMKRERRRRQRLADAASRRKEFSDRFVLFSWLLSSYYKAIDI